MTLGVDFQYHSKCCLDVNQMTGLLSELTEVYRKYSSSTPYEREIAVLEVMWKGSMFEFDDDDDYAGRYLAPPIGFTPQDDDGTCGYYIRTRDIDLMLASDELLPENRTRLQELTRFWEANNTIEHCRQAYPEGMKAVLKSDNYAGEPGIGFTLWRISGLQLDYKKLVRLGISGLKKEISQEMGKGKDDQFYSTMLRALDIFTEIATTFASMARQKAEEINDENRKKVFMRTAASLYSIATDAPKTIRDALQLIYLYGLVAGVRNFGRMDDALAEVYLADPHSDEEKLDAFIGMWKLMRCRPCHTWFPSKGFEGYRYDTRLIIGGKGRENEAAADQVALLIMEASNIVRDTLPQIALRFYDGQNPALYQKGLDILASGYTFPMLYNDEVNIPASAEAFGVSLEEAEEVIQFGCGEYVFNHCSVATPSAVCNLLEALLLTLNHGKDLADGKAYGLQDGPESFNSFEELWEAYCRQLEHQVDWLALHEKLEYDEVAKDSAFLYSSILMDDCIGRGKALLDGGIRYLDGTLESYGNTNTADSLCAIKKLVFDEKKITLPELTAALKRNFEGDEILRKQLLACPKYGNDDPEADEMYMKVHDHICNYVRAKGQESGLHAYLVVVINNDANTKMGLYTPASPDGRKAFVHMNPGNNPMPGSDRNGITALLNSLVKPDTHIHAGAVQNLKLSKEMFTSHRPQVEALLQSYFDQGGAQLMMTVVSRHDLEDAMVHPENYQNLIVRVGGFSERFVNLPRCTQMDVLQRTLY